MVNQNYRWFPAPARARRLLREGALGDLIACYLDFHLYFGTDYRYFFLEEPLLSDMAIHHFDSLRFVLDDEPVEVSCHSWAAPGTPFAGHPAAVATMRFARGTVVSYRGSWLTHGPGNPVRGPLAPGRHPRHRRIQLPRRVRRTVKSWIASRSTGRTRRLKPPKLPAMPYQDRKGALAYVRALDPRRCASGGGEHGHGQPEEPRPDVRGDPLRPRGWRDGAHDRSVGDDTMTRSLRITVWNEFRHERSNPQVGRVYPDGIHEALAAPLRAAGHAVRTATLDEAEHGLGGDVLDDDGRAALVGASGARRGRRTKSWTASRRGCSKAWG